MHKVFDISGINEQFQHPEDVFVWPLGKFAINVLGVILCLSAVSALVLDVLVSIKYTYC